MFWKPWRRNIRLFLSLNGLIFKFLICSLIYLNVEYMYVDLINLLLISSSDSNRTLNANGQRLHIRSLIVLSLQLDVYPQHKSPSGWLPPGKRVHVQGA